MRRVLTLLGLLVLSACQTPMQTGSTCVVAPGFLDEQTTFTWRSDKAIDVDDRTGYVSPIMQKGLTQMVVKEMATKGFEFVEREEGDGSAEPQWADIEVALTLRTRRELVSMTVNDSPCVDTDCWERVNPGTHPADVLEVA